MKIYRQGDVMLVSVRAIPEGAQAVECDGPLGVGANRRSSRGTSPIPE
jgi:hypothetical protein